MEQADKNVMAMQTVDPQRPCVERVLHAVWVGQAHCVAAVLDVRPTCCVDPLGDAKRETRVTFAPIPSSIALTPLPTVDHRANVRMAMKETLAPIPSCIVLNLHRSVAQKGVKMAMLRIPAPPLRTAFPIRISA